MSIYRRKSGKWAVRIDIDREASGKRVRKNLGTFQTRKDAERAERSALDAKDRGIDLSPKTVTVAELLDRYLADRETIGRGAKTLQEYRSTADRLIRPHLGNTPLSKLRPARIAEWRDHLLARGGKSVKDKDGNLRERSLSPKTVWHAFTLLNGACRFAVRMELITRNPCEVVSRPSIRRSEAKALTTDEISRLLFAARSTRWEPFLTLALSTGARRGELAALSWFDFDEDKGTLTIRHSLSQTKTGVALKAPKTNTVRSIPLSALARGALKRQRALQQKEQEAAGSAYCNPDDAIFTNELGERITPMAATCAFDRIARKANVSTKRLHDLRHNRSDGVAALGRGREHDGSHPRTRISGHDAANLQPSDARGST